SRTHFAVGGQLDAQSGLLFTDLASHSFCQFTNYADVAVMPGDAPDAERVVSLLLEEQPGTGPAADGLVGNQWSGDVQCGVGAPFAVEEILTDQQLVPMAPSPFAAQAAVTVMMSIAPVAGTECGSLLRC